MINKLISKNNFYTLLTAIVVIITVVFSYSLISSKQPIPKNIHIRLVTIPYQYQPANLRLLINNKINLNEFEKLGDTVLNLEKGQYTIEASILNDNLSISKQFTVSTEDTLYLDIIYEHIPEKEIIIEKYKESYFNYLTRDKKYTLEEVERFKKSLDTIINDSFLRSKKIDIGPKNNLKIEIRDFQYIL